MTAISTTAPHQVLDPSLLGRPVHLLPTFAAQLRDDLAQALRLPGNRRYWGPFQVGAAGFTRAQAGAAHARWLNYAAPDGTLGFRLERSLLLGVLNHRYGEGEPVAAAQLAALRVTATEERLALALGQQLAGVLVRRIALNRGAPADAVPPVLQGGAGATPAPGSWLLQVTICDDARAAAGQLWFALDQPLMASVLRGLLPARHLPKGAPHSVRPLAARLQVRLAGRLMSQEIALGSLFDLRVGDVIPISLNRTDVLLDDSRLFTAAVTEHKGKLCLTAFEDAD